jgi:hypothetical protein
MIEPDQAYEMPDNVINVALAALGTIRQRLASAFELIETLKAQVNGDGGETLAALQETLADIQVSNLPELESMFCVMFVNIDPEQGVVYDRIADEDPVGASD